MKVRQSAIVLHSSTRLQSWSKQQLTFILHRLCTTITSTGIYTTALITLHIELWEQDNWFVYVTCFIIINQLVLWDPPINYYSISRQQGSVSNPSHSALRTSCLELSVSSYEKFRNCHRFQGTSENWNCSLLHATRSNISFAACASYSNSRHMAAYINVFCHWHLTLLI